MGYLIVGVLCVAICQPLTAQIAADPVARHRAEFNQIERGLSKYRTVQADREDLGLEVRSVEGGWLQAYCDGSDVRLIFAEDDGETATATASFYFQHDSVFFAYFRSGRGIPNGIDPYPKRTIWNEERLYFTDGSLIRWLGDQNERRAVTTLRARRRAAEVLAEAREYRELMADCTPHPRPRSAEAERADSLEELTRRVRAIYAVTEWGIPRSRRTVASMASLGLVPKSDTVATLEAYCESSHTLLIANQNGSDRYYVMNDSLFFVFRRRPSGEQARFYFTDRQLFRWLGDKNLPRDPMSPEGRNHAERLLSNADRYLALMRNCPSPHTSR